MYKPGEVYHGEFTTQRFDTGVATDADALPTVTANRNGTDDGAFVLTAAKLDTGRYKITGTVPAGYVAGDKVNVSVAATVNSVAGKRVVDRFVVDTSRVSDLASGASGTGAIPVDENYGSAGALRFLDSLGQPVTNGLVQAYKAADYNSSLRGRSALKGETTTDAAGNWRAPFMLDAGNYVFLFYSNNAAPVVRKFVTIS